MSDDPTNPGPEDGKLISLKQRHESRYWTSSLNATRKELEHAIALVGRSASAVRKLIETARGLKPAKPRKRTLPKAD